jgi:hypothetical protein
MLKRALGVLTPEQRRKWDELTGEPFKGDFHGWPESAPDRRGRHFKGDFPFALPKGFGPR